MTYAELWQRVQALFPSRGSMSLDVSTWRYEDGSTRISWSLWREGGGGHVTADSPERLLALLTAPAAPTVEAQVADVGHPIDERAPAPVVAVIQTPGLVGL